MCLSSDKAARIARKQAQEQREAAAAQIAEANRDTEGSREDSESRLRRIAGSRGFLSAITGGGGGMSGLKVLTGQ